jgi:hypothetical protein
MAREGHERHTKHCQDVGGSSNCAPLARNKHLTKRRRPSSYKEESSPEDSPLRGGTPKSPDELECLKIMTPTILTNQEVVNYSKEDPMNLITLQNRTCYPSSKKRGTDERFWTFFHQDWYLTVLYLKTSLVVRHQWADIDYMRNKKDIHFNRILEACDFHGIIDLLQFRHNWNQEVITEFYSTLFFDKKERIFMWMTNDRRFNVKLSQFAQIIGLSSQLDIIKKLHSRWVMMPREMTAMYIPDSDFQDPKVDASLRPAVPKDPRAHRSSSSAPVVAPPHTTRSGGASSSSSQSSRMLKMLRGIFAMCRRTDQLMDVMEQQMWIMHHNQEIFHSPWDEPLLEFLDIPVYPPVADPYASLTPAELAAFGIGPSHPLVSYDDDDEDEEAANDKEETEDDE